MKQDNVEYIIRSALGLREGDFALHTRAYNRAVELLTPVVTAYNGLAGLHKRDDSVSGVRGLEAKFNGAKALWQEYIKIGSGEPFGDFVEDGMKQLFRAGDTWLQLVKRYLGIEETQQYPPWKDLEPSERRISTSEKYKGYNP